jgi:hypothetical protein
MQPPASAAADPLLDRPLGGLAPAVTNIDMEKKDAGPRDGKKAGGQKTEETHEVI